MARAGFTGLKLDTVAIRGFNDDELVDLIEFGKQVTGGSAVYRIYGRRGRERVVSRKSVFPSCDAHPAESALWDD